MTVSAADVCVFVLCVLFVCVVSCHSRDRPAWLRGVSEAAKPAGRQALPAYDSRLFHVLCARRESVNFVATNLVFCCAACIRIVQCLHCQCLICQPAIPVGVTLLASIDAHMLHK